MSAGPATFIAANYAPQPESLVVARARPGATRLGDTGPIAPQSTAQLTVDLGAPGRYLVAARGAGRIAPAPVTVAGTRSSAGVLLTP